MKNIKVIKNTGNNEWNTPKKFTDSAKIVMGKITLDPASNKSAQCFVKAKKFYSKKNNALEKKWKGKIWMNPPYSNGTIGKFIDKFIQEYENGNIKEAVVLVNNGTETRWFQKLIALVDNFVFVKGRISFFKPNGETGPPLQGQIIMYIGGKNKTKFKKEFSKYGIICDVKK